MKQKDRCSEKAQWLQERTRKRKRDYASVWLYELRTVVAFGRFLFSVW